MFPEKLNPADMTVNVRTFKTCSACRRTLRLGMFVNARTRQISDECQFCKYQAFLTERPVRQHGASRLWRSAVRNLSRGLTMTAFVLRGDSIAPRIGSGGMISHN